MIMTGKDVSEGKGVAHHGRNVALEQILATVAQTIAGKGVSVAEEDVRF